MADDMDYMSDIFVAPEKDIKKSIYKPARYEREPKLSKRELEETNRKEGLAKPLDSDNKGFNLLLKMGYKPGSGLGKTESGRETPIDFSLKIDKKGFGTKYKNNVQVKDAIKEISLDHYRKSVIEKFHSKFQCKDLQKMQRICKELDLAAELEVPMKWFYWPPNEQKLKLDDEEEEDVIEIKEFVTEPEKLEAITSYLRIMFSYCFYCGCKFTDSEDLAVNCPGPTKDDHE